MNAMSLLVMLVVAIGLASVGVLLYGDVVKDAQKEVSAPAADATARIINVVGANITDDTVGHVRISVTTDGKLRLNDTLITLRTDNDTARLQYRNGTLERNVTSGFYTQ